MYIRVRGATGVEGYLNAMQLELIPEPSTIMLVGLSLLALLGLRRRNL
jgi:hypothetical protein